MKRIIIPMMFLLLMSFVLAPPSPMPFVAFFTFNGQPVENFRITLTIDDETVIRYTNNVGGVAVDVGEASGDFPSANFKYDTLVMSCGFSVCDKSYVLLDLDTPHEETFALTESPPQSCSPCDCGGSGGGSGCYIPPQDCDEEDCQEVVCKTCPKPSCPDVTSCPDTTCPTTHCPDDCPPIVVCDYEDNNIWGMILVGILSMGGGAGIFFKLFNNKILLGNRTGMKTYRGLDGTLKIHHKHPGTTGYHSTEISHRSPETHPKGKVDVANHYSKNSKGEWEYR